MSTTAVFALLAAAALVALAVVGVRVALSPLDHLDFGGSL